MSSDDFNGLIGLEVLSASPDEMTAQLPISDKLRQPYGLVHGGVLASIAETLASVGTHLGVQEQGNLAVGMSNHTSFLRPMLDGTIHAVARPRHRGRTTWLWDVDMSDDAGRACAVSRVTIAVRPQRP